MRFLLPAALLFNMAAATSSSDSSCPCVDQKYSCYGTNDGVGPACWPTLPGAINGKMCNEGLTYCGPSSSSKIRDRVFRTTKSSTNDDNKVESTVCDLTALTLSCSGENEVLKVLSARYGVKSNLCSSAKCQEADVLQHVSERCDGQQQCDFVVNEDAFGSDLEDPCPNSLKAFEYEYECVATTTTNNFDFGDDCSAGEGEFQLSLDTAGEVQDLGIIPTGTFDVQINLESDNDLDIALYDLDHPDFGTTGKAIVLWCSQATKDAGGNCGLLGGSKSQEFGDYEDMTIEYSGYFGTGVKRGNEYIKIQGMTTRRLMMRVNPYKAGNAKVKYTWGEGCGGRFSLALEEEQRIVVGEVPAGVSNFKVEMRSKDTKNDLDVQLYDKNTKTRGHAEGDAIIAYCSRDRDSDCNFGAVTAKSWIEGEYHGLNYKYSGYYGIGSERGHETIEVEGTTNRALVMEAYGYEAGTATITYSYL